MHLNQQQYDLTYVIEPSNGEVDVEINGNLISSFPYTTTEFYGTNISLDAKSNITWDFAYMTPNNGYFTGQSISPVFSFNVDKSDTITIYYDENIFYNVSYEVYPKGSGQIKANNIFIGDTIMTVAYALNESVSLEAIANNGHGCFLIGTSKLTYLIPVEDNSNVNFTVEFSDNIRANFKEMFEVYVPNSFTPANDDNLHKYIRCIYLLNRGCEI